MGAITFRPLDRDDFELLATWLARPHVHRWWNHEFTPAALERDFGGALDGDEPTDLLVVLLDDRPIGLAQWYRMDAYPEYVDELEPLVELPEGSASIDYLIGEPDLVGRGVGTAMLRALTDRIWTAAPCVTCLIVPVSTANVASWTALLRAGFRLVAQGDLEPDNPIDDPVHEILRLDRPPG